MKRILVLLPLLLAGCATNSQPTVDPPDVFMSETASLLPKLGVMGTAMSQSPDILNAIQGRQPVTILFLRDDVLSGVMKARNTTAQAFFATSEGQTFLKNHVVTSSIVSHGAFTSLGGLTWTVGPDQVPPYGPFIVNGQDSEGCYVTLSNTTGSGHQDVVCGMKGDITGGK